jgi:PAS domain S-box-containing protein
VAIEDPSAGFFETARDLLQVESPDGCFVKTNESLRRVLGYSEAELLKTFFFDLVSPDDLPTVDGALQTLEKGCRAVDFECRCRVADGFYAVLQWSVSKHAATGVRYWVGRDVTERKRTEGPAKPRLSMPPKR